MYSVSYTRNAIKDLATIPKAKREAIQQKMDALARNPYAPNNNVKALQGGEGYRLRVGDYRVVYFVEDQMLVVEVVRVKHRKEAYT